MNEPDEVDRFTALGISISDGVVLDWQSAEGTTTTEMERLLLEELKLLADIARVHRSRGPDPTSASRSRPKGAPENARVAGEEHQVMAARAKDEARKTPISWGHLEIRSLIGAGAFGEVYRAWDPRLDLEVALKLIRRPELHSSSGVSLVEEGRLLARVRHPNVVRIYGADRIGGHVGLWMDYVRGHTLEGILRERGVLGAKEATLIGLDLCSALASVHCTGLVHRDLKAKNVMREQGGRVVLMDFGSARSLSAEEERLPDISGTPLYMAPEVLQGEEATVRSDLYSLGVLLYHLVTGSYPVLGRSIRELRLAHELGQRGLLRDERSDLPDSFVGVVERCLATHPSGRFASAGETEQALASVLGASRGEHPGILANRPPEEMVPRFPASLSHREIKSAVAPAMRRIGRWTLVAALILIAILFGVPRVTRWIGGANARTVLVLPMEVRGQTDGADYLGRAFSEALAVNLAQARALTVLPVPVNAVGGGASREPARAARSAGAGRVVTGSILRQGKTLQASLSLVDAGGNRILWGTQRTAPDDSLTNLAIALAGNIAAELGAKSPKRYEYFLYLTGTPTMAASPAFGEALGSVRRLDAPTALVATQRLIQAFPNEPDAHLLRTAALFMDNWEVRQDPIKRRAFEQSAETLHRIDPQNPWVEHFRAMFAARDGRVDEMIDRLTRILGRQDLTPAARANILSIRSQWQAIQGNSTAAISGIEEALRLNPTDDLDLAIAGGTLLQLGRREDALVRARQAIALNPSSTQNQFLLGDSLYQLGRWDESTSPLGKACELRKGQVHCAYYALALQRAGRVPEALAQATTAIALPESDWGTSILASYHALAGHRDEALRLLRRSLELSPSPTEADVNHTLNDPDLASLRDAPEFKAILAEMKKRAQIR